MVRAASSGSVVGEGVTDDGDHLVTHVTPGRCTIHVEPPFGRTDRGDADLSAVVELAASDVAAGCHVTLPSAP